MLSTLVLFSALALLAGAPAAPAGAAAPALETGGEEAPPGAPEDRALWGAGLDVSNRVVIERTNATRWQFHIKQHRLAERLAEQAKRDDEGGKRAEALSQKLLPVQLENYTTLTRQWPVDPTRGCRYEVLVLEGAMAGTEKPWQMTVAREQLKECVEKGRAALAVMAASNQKLGALVADAERMLPPVEPGKFAAIATPAEKLPQNAAAATDDASGSVKR
jgi:hypothetical protein